MGRPSPYVIFSIDSERYARPLANVQGQIVPVLDTRKVFHLKARDPGEIVEGDQILPGLRHLRGAVKLHDGMILDQDLEKIAAELALGAAATRAVAEAR